MANQPDYYCTRCNISTKRELLTVKKAVFTEVGMYAKTIRSRTTDWLCPNCVATDPDYNRETIDSPSYRPRAKQKFKEIQNAS